MLTGLLIASLSASQGCCQHMCYETDFVNFIGSEGTNFVVSFSPKGYMCVWFLVYAAYEFLLYSSIRSICIPYTQRMHSYYILVNAAHAFRIRSVCIPYTQRMRSYYILPSPPTLHFSLCATAYYIYESIFLCFPPSSLNPFCLCMWCV